MANAVDAALCAELSCDRHTILDITNQRRSSCGLGICDPNATGAFGYLRGRAMKGAASTTLIAGPNGSITIPVQEQIFGTTGFSDPGDSVGITWRNLLRSDTDLLKGGAPQQSFSFLAVGLGVQAQGVHQLTAATSGSAIPGNTEVHTTPLTRQLNDYDRELSRMYFDLATLTSSSADTECTSRFGRLCEYLTPIGVRNADVPTNGALNFAADFTSFMAAMLWMPTLRNQQQFNVDVDHIEVLANDSSDPVGLTAGLAGTTDDTTLTGTVYIRYMLVLYGFVVAVPELLNCGVIG